MTPVSNISATSLDAERKRDVLPSLGPAQLQICKQNKYGQCCQKKKVTDFCMLILYPATLLNMFIITSSFCLESLGLLICTIISSAYNDSFTFSLTIWMPFISFSYLITVAGISNTVLNKSGKRGYCCLVPDFSRKAFSFSPLSIMLPLSLS